MNRPSAETFPSRNHSIALALAWVTLSTVGIVHAQVPTVRFASDQVFVSQRNGSVSIPVVIENSSEIEGFFIVD